MISIDRFILLSVLVLQLAGCSSSRKADNKSSLNITNGKAIPAEEYSSVVLIEIAFESEDKVTKARCSGTFVSVNQILTSAHCVLNEERDKIGKVSYLAQDSDQNFKTVAVAESVKPNPQYDGTELHDLAIVTFAENIAPSVSIIAQDAPKLGTSLTLVGFGSNQATLADDEESWNESGAGVKRIGTNTLVYRKDGIIQVTGVLGPNPSLPDFEGKVAAAASGDSGSPLYASNQIVGVASKAGPTKRPVGGTVFQTEYTDLTSPESKAFLSTINLTSTVDTTRKPTPIPTVTVTPGAPGTGRFPEIVSSISGGSGCPLNDVKAVRDDISGLLTLEYTGLTANTANLQAFCRYSLSLNIPQNMRLVVEPATDARVNIEAALSADGGKVNGSYYFNSNFNATANFAETTVPAGDAQTLNPPIAATTVRSGCGTQEILHFVTTAQVRRGIGTLTVKAVGPFLFKLIECP
ncbi:MAG TPA: trypsin-like serine protease [Oligoflexus sp.]|uniref:trypsin-like serine protease n=1 Tax=Oligoflexus sp. TaxID=1971216 RepID=UPI002D2B58C1|nr:trypsin-like serine protease [Oligoflexus sp.]HYX35270.1 trypsin-like serine protease [Oligoflexus sp.]